MLLQRDGGDEAQVGGPGCVWDYFRLLFSRALSPALSVASLPFRRGPRPLSSRGISPDLSVASLPFLRGSRPLSSPDLSVASLLSVPWLRVSLSHIYHRVTEL